MNEDTVLECFSPSLSLMAIKKEDIERMEKIMNERMRSVRERRGRREREEERSKKRVDNLINGLDAEG